MPSHASAGPDYATSEYWQQRFSSASEPFDWLNDGIDSLLTPLLSYLDSIYASSGSCSHSSQQGPAVLHIGVGSSRLSLALFDHYLARGWDTKKIVNVDFAHSAICAARELEAGHRKRQMVSSTTGNHTACHDHDEQMSYVQADLLDWSSIQIAMGRVRDSYARPFSSKGFDAILDKSTTDAISTGEDVAFDLRSHDAENGKSSYSPGLASFLGGLSNLAPSKYVLSPVHILSLNLQSLASERCRWFLLSYSQCRFRDVPYADDESANNSWPWHILSLKEWQAVPSRHGGKSAVVHTPTVYHWVYELVLKEAD